MEDLNFLEPDRTFRSYYRTLRDVNYYLNNDPEIDSNELQTANRVITKLILDFIRLDGTTFRDMDPEQFAREFQIFIPDFLAIIQNSGVNDVDFLRFSELLDEMLGIVGLRASALEKIPKALEDETTEANELESWDGMVEINVENSNNPVDSDEIPTDDDIEAAGQIEILQIDEDENEGDAENEDDIEQLDVQLVEVLNIDEADDEETPIVNERINSESLIDDDESENITSNQVNKDESGDYTPIRRYRYE